MRIKRVMFLVFLFVAIIGASCSNQEVELLSEQVAKLEKGNKDLISKQERLQKDLKFYQEKVKSMETMIDKNSAIKDQQVNMISSTVDLDSTKEILFPIYTADPNTYENKISHFILIPKEGSIEEKLNRITDSLSMFFSNLPIELLRIENVHNKQVAIINLLESSENQGISDYKQLKGMTWRMYYFQGSTGAYVTEITLIESILQRGYNGKWIDGVQFLYENSSEGYGHVEQLFRISYRSSEK